MMSASSPRYVIVSPVKDEAEYIELTLRSVNDQSLKPVKWVIVDDGSTDRTAEIIERYAAAHRFITLQRSPAAGSRDTGRAEVQAFHRGYEALVGTGFDFVVKLDGDLSFGPDYFETLLARMASDVTLGIASGIYLEADKRGVWKTVPMPSYHAFGACKVVRRQCFEQIDRFATVPGWDTADEIRAWNKGWKTRHFEDLEVRHHRPEGSAMGFLSTNRMYGEIHYVTGGDPLFLLFKVLHRLWLKPYVLGALAMSFGYLAAIARRRPRLVTREEAIAYRQVLRRRLSSAARIPFVESVPKL
jgi:poly-beta-1,6-N-acetyl-D-glucosamine synthase